MGSGSGFGSIVARATGDVRRPRRQVSSLISGYFFLFYETRNCHTLLGQALLGSLAPWLSDPTTNSDSVWALGLFLDQRVGVS